MKKGRQEERKAEKEVVEGKVMIRRETEKGLERRKRGKKENVGQEGEEESQGEKKRKKLRREEEG